MIALGRRSGERGLPNLHSQIIPEGSRLRHGVRSLNNAGAQRRGLLGHDWVVPGEVVVAIRGLLDHSSEVRWSSMGPNDTVNVFKHLCLSCPQIINLNLSFEIRDF